MCLNCVFKVANEMPASQILMKKKDVVKCIHALMLVKLDSLESTRRLVKPIVTVTDNRVVIPLSMGLPLTFVSRAHAKAVINGHQ